MRKPKSLRYYIHFLRSETFWEYVERKLEGQLVYTKLGLLTYYITLGVGKRKYTDYQCTFFYKHQSNNQKLDYNAPIV